MRKMIEVKEYNTTEGKEVVLNNGLVIKANGDIEVGKNAVVDGNVVLNGAENLVDKEGNPLSFGGGLFSDFTKVVDCNNFTPHATKAKALLDEAGFVESDLKPWPTSVKCKFINGSHTQGELADGYCEVYASKSGDNISWGWNMATIAPTYGSTKWVTASGNDAVNDSYVAKKRTNAMPDPLYQHTISFTHETTTRTIYIVNNSATKLETLTAIKNALSTALCAKIDTHDILSMTGNTTALTIKYIWYDSNNVLSITERPIASTDTISDTVTVY